MDSKKFWKNLKPYDPDQYEGETLHSLTLIGIAELNEHQIQASYDNITVVLFKLFPDKFSLTEYSEYPDSQRVSMSLAHCKTDLLIKGEYTKGVFTLTGTGQQIADDLLDNLQSDSKSKYIRTDKNRKKSIKLTKEVTETSGFKNFRASNFKEIKKFDLCECLHCTINADEDHLQQNYGLLLHYVNSCRKFEKFSEVSQWVLDYLEYLQTNWVRLVNE